MKLGNLEILFHGNVGHVCNYSDADEIRLNLTNATKFILEQKKIDRLSYGNGEEYLEMMELREEYSGGS